MKKSLTICLMLFVVFAQKARAQEPLKLVATTPNVSLRQRHGPTARQPKGIQNNHARTVQHCHLAHRQSHKSGAECGRSRTTPATDVKTIIFSKLNAGLL